MSATQPGTAAGRAHRARLETTDLGTHDWMLRDILAIEAEAAAAPPDAPSLRAAAKAYRHAIGNWQRKHHEGQYLDDEVMAAADVLDAALAATPPATGGLDVDVLEAALFEVYCKPSGLPGIVPVYTWSRARKDAAAIAAAYAATLAGGEAGE